MNSVNHATVHPIKSHTLFKPLTDEEILEFFEDLDADGDGFITFEELEAKFKDVQAEIIAEPDKQEQNAEGNPRRQQVSDLEKTQTESNPEHDGIHAFLLSLMPGSSASLSRDDVIKHVKAWNVPSQNQNSAEDQDKLVRDYEKKLSVGRRVRAYWAIHGPKKLFRIFVALLQLGFGLWQLLVYVNNTKARAAFGSGIVVAKGAAGVLYPTLFFMILSMGRWYGTFSRRLYYTSRFVNWDLHQDFHIRMALVGLFFASLHGLAHLSGTFVHGSRPEYQKQVNALLKPSNSPRSYTFYLRTSPGWTGIVALGLFWMITILSEPHVRRWSYEVFQIGHLLMFPMIGLLIAHGTTHLFQYPMLGFWLAIPTLFVVLERGHRIYRGFRRIPATLKVLDDDTVTLICRNPNAKPWSYAAGQYIFLQVPTISFFQWHPFTISACQDDTIQLHIKNGGDFTRRLRNLPQDVEIFVGIDGPFGAPAQRFYEYDRALIVGAGVGITPFSAILTHLEGSLQADKDPWSLNRVKKIVSLSTPSLSIPASRHSRKAISISRPLDSKEIEAITSEVHHGINRSREEDTIEQTYCARRVDFHWLVREKNHLLWFSDLLNRASDFSLNTRRGVLDLNIHTHITMKRQKISTHVFLYLLDAYRTPSVPVSAITGLRSRSEFGRPEFETILGNFHEDTFEGIRDEKIQKGEKIAVFFCGNPSIGMVLSDLCEQLSLRGRTDGSGIRWDFRMEVFE